MKLPDPARIRRAVQRFPAAAWTRTVDGAYLLRNLAVRGGIVGLVVFAVLAAGVAAATVPIPGKGCPPAFKAALTGAVDLPAGSPPVLAVSVISADSDAIGNAEVALSDHADAMTAAEDAVEVAAELTAKAESASYESTYDDTYSLESAVDSAKSSVEYAQEAVDSDEDDLQSAQDDAASDDGSLGAYYQDAVSYAEESLASDTKDLKSAKSDLAKAKAKLSKAKASLAAAKKDVEALTTQAYQATLDASELSDSETSKQNSLAAAVEAATRQQAEHVTESVLAVALWTHLHRESVDRASAVNAVRRSCRSSGYLALGLAGGLGGLAVLLVLGNVIAVRRHERWDAATGQ